MATDFFTKLTAAARTNDSLLCVGLDPTLDAVPAAWRQAANPILAWNQAIIEATADLVCAYKPNIAFYEALDDGLATLKATLRLIPPHIPVILDAKRGDIGSTASAYAHAIFDLLAVDAVTLSPYLGADSLAPFAAYAERGLFILCHTSNPGAAAIQELPTGSRPDQPAALAGATPLYLQVAQQALTWSAYPNIGLVVGATFPQALTAVRQVAPQAWFLVPGVGAQAGDLAAAVQAALRPDGLGVIINASRGVTGAPDPRQAAAALRAAINAARLAPANEAARGPASGRAALLTGLYELGAIRFGQFTLASGLPSPLYIDLRLLVSDPARLQQAAAAYAAALTGVAYDRLAGVPYAALPIGTALSLHLGKPLLYPRKEVKAYGLGKAIEGAWLPGERVVVIEDLVTSGGSTLKTVELLRAAGLVVEDVVVLIDREQGARAALAAAGLRLHAVFTLGEVLDSLHRAGLLDTASLTAVRAYLAEQAAV
jgi:uridine monophosphate synthetase